MHGTAVPPRNGVRRQALLHHEFLLQGAHEELNCAQPRHGNGWKWLSEHWGPEAMPELLGNPRSRQ